MAAFSADFSSALTAAVSLAVSSPAAIRAEFNSALDAGVNLSVSSNKSLAAEFNSALDAGVNLSVSRKQNLAAAFGSSLEASVNLRGSSDLLAMNICDVISAQLAMWGMFCRKSAPDFALQRAIDDLNSALQLVWNNAEERSYWSNETLNVTIGIGDNTFVIQDNIQNVIGPCRLDSNKSPLALVGSLSEIENFVELFLEGNTPDTPVAYYIDREKQVGEEPVLSTLIVAPPTTEETFLLLDVVLEAPHYTLADLDACPIIPIPHKYVESLLRPIAIFLGTSYYLFRQKDQLEAINREYLQARAALGLADPLPGKSGDNLDRRDSPKQ